MAIDTKNRGGERAEERKEIAQLWLKAPAEQLQFMGTKKTKKNGERHRQKEWREREREREREWTF
jgi:hypothetical protein